MPIDIYKGDDVRIGLAVNAETSGLTFDGTPGSYDCVKVNSVKIESRTGKEPIKDATIFPTGVIYGAEFFTITVKNTCHIRMMSWYSDCTTAESSTLRE